MNTIAAGQIIYRENVSAKAKAVFQYLAYRSNRENTCFPALKTIAKECAISVSSVQRGLRELLALGFIRKKHNYRVNGSQTSNIYEVIIGLEDRARAVKENAQQRMRELRRQQEYREAKKQQIKMKLEPCSKEGQTKGENKSVLGLFIKSLKLKHLTRGDSQKDQPGTLTY